MLTIAYSGLLNAQIARTAIWTSSWKLYFSSAAAASLRSRRALHGALAWRRIAGTSIGTLTGRRRGRLIGGADTIHPNCCRCSGAGAAGAGCAGAALLNSSPLLMRLLQGCPNEAHMHPPSPRWHDVAIEVVQQFKLEKSL